MTLYVLWNDLSGTLTGSKKTQFQDPVEVDVADYQQIKSQLSLTHGLHPTSIDIVSVHESLVGETGEWDE